MSVAALSLEKLSPASTTSERVDALAELLETQLVARAVGVTTTAVRKWIAGTEPRPDATMTIDDLRSVAVVLLEAGFEPSRIRSWLLSGNPDWLENKRPLDCISQIPGLVISAANDAAIVHRFGAEAAAHAVDNGRS